MESTSNKKTLNDIKNIISKTSKDVSYFILMQVILGLILVILFAIAYYLFFAGDVSSIVSNFITIDVYSFVAGIALMFLYASSGFKVLACLTIIFSLLYFAINILLFALIFRLSRSFKQLEAEEKTLIQASKIQKWFIVFVSLSSLAFFLPSFGWIIAIMLANAGLNVSFYNFHVILDRYGLKPTVLRNSAYHMLAGSFITIVFALLLFIDIFYLPGMIVGYIFYYFAFNNMKNHILFVSPIMKNTPPPPSIPAPSVPPPKPVIGSNGKIDIAKVPSPPASDYDEDK
ncbi:MAG: hypothetical protein GPJ50_13250 [Candidatus Heimdallarchaeota archaeon]|nr:hypothetical protein [Candidatus Heimdallarchaeota archaeon]